jgi:AraC-like DNA-binding protein
MMQEAELIEQLSRLRVYRDFEQAFSQVTGLSVQLRTLGMWNLACALLNREGRFTSITIVPVWLGENIIGVLQTGRAALEEPMSGQLADRKKPVANPVVAKNSSRRINGQVPVFSRPRYEAMVHLLQIFAEQLSFYASQIVIRLDEREPYRVRVARTFISSHRADNIDLADVARATHVSTFYLCKIFKKATGLTFVEYRNRLRIESAKKLLLNPNLTVSEVAYSVGFQSLTQFNRLFRRVVGMAPTGFRGHLAPERAPGGSERIAVLN